MIAMMRRMSRKVRVIRLEMLYIRLEVRSLASSLFVVSNAHFFPHCFRLKASWPIDTWSIS